MHFLTAWRFFYKNVIFIFSQVLAHNLLVVLATVFPNDFTPEVHVAMDKFLAAVAHALSEKYR